MMVFKRNQIVVLSLVLMIVVAGYLQYSYKQSSTSLSEKDNSKIGEAVYVDNSLDAGKTTAQADAKQASAAKTASDTKVTNNSKTTNASVSASKQANDFFAQAKLDREITRGKDSEALKALSSDNAASKDAKAKAYDKMIKLVDNSQKEMRLETLIKEKGFGDVLALFGDDGSLDIVVKSPNLTSAQTAQICDIVTRQANVPISKIHIKNIY